MAMKTRPRRLWFRAKALGWGWVPVTWEGWVVTLLATLAYTGVTIAFGGWLGAIASATFQAKVLGIIEFIGSIALITYILIRICYRFGESPTWRWRVK